jgi:hypothetical protein
MIMKKPKQNDDIQWYDLRVNELETFRGNTASKTLSSLIDTAKLKSDTVVQLLIRLQKMTLVMIAAHDIKTKEKNEFYKENIPKYK